MKIDHIAILSTDIDRSVKWYSNRLPDSKVLYQDETWGMIEKDNFKIAFVLERHHPPHIAFCIDDLPEEDLEKFKNKGFKKHRDKSSSFYERDPDGNFIEIIKYEEN